MQQAANPICRTCGTAMILNRVIPCAADYDIRSYNCAECAAVFSMVEARTTDRSSVDERRVVPRHAVTTPATIKMGASAIACMVRDVSAAGACLSLTGRPQLPDHFTLVADGSPLPCHTIWRGGRQIGIAFD
jgi:hypothetical protein